MKQLYLYTLFGIVTAGLVYAGTENVSGQLAHALPQPSTIMICASGMAFFKFVSKRVR